MYSDENLILQLAGLESAHAENMGDSTMAPSGTWGLASYPLASVFAPLQEWRDAYSEEEALHRGTLFRQLDKPFLGQVV